MIVTRNSNTCCVLTFKSMVYPIQKMTSSKFNILSFVTFYTMIFRYYMNKKLQHIYLKQISRVTTDSAVRNSRLLTKLMKFEKSGLVFLYCLKMLSFMWQQFCKKGATTRIKWQICNARDVECLEEENIKTWTLRGIFLTLSPIQCPNAPKLDNVFFSWILSSNIWNARLGPIPLQSPCILEDPSLCPRQIA